MQHDRKTLEDALIDVEVSNTHAIALGRRFFGLRQEAERIKDEIARVNAKRFAPSNVAASIQDVPPVPLPLDQESRPKPELKVYLDAINDRDFVDGMEWNCGSGIPLSLNGWAFLSVSEPPVISVLLKAVGAGTEAQGLAQRTMRQDVADHFNRPDVVFCGFSAEISLFAIQSTSVELQIEARDGQDNTYVQSLGILNLTQ